jgi:hypothetical protein
VATKSDLTTPSSSSLTTFTNGAGNFIDAVDANGNFAYLLGQLITLNNVIADQMPQLGVASVYTALQSFTTIAVNIINEATLNGDIVLDCNGSGKVRYSDGSSDTEVASKGYVQGVAFTAGNVPAGGTAGTYLRGDGSWQAIGFITDPTIRTSGFTAVNGTRYLCDSTSTGFTVTLPPTPTAGMRVGVIDTTGGAGTNPITIGRNGSLIMNLAEDMTISVAYARVYLVFDTVRGWVLV